MDALQKSPSVVDRSERSSAVREALRRIPHLPNGAVDWEFEDSTLVLRGCVASFHAKQLVQAAALRLPGVKRVVNEIEVDDQRIGPTRSDAVLPS